MTEDRQPVAFEPDAVYTALAADFPETHQDRRGGIDIEYVTGEQVVSRLNEVIGYGAWSFTIIAHGLSEEADEYWVLGDLTVHVSTGPVHRQQFGSQKVKRSRSSGAPLDIGFDLKGATTDALKKCATLIGVGLYLSHKESQGPREQDAAPERANGNGQSTHASSSRPAPVPIPCAECAEPLTDTRFKDNSVWTAAKLAEVGRKKFGRVLCMPHYREANEALKNRDRPAVASQPEPAPESPPPTTTEDLSQLPF